MWRLDRKHVRTGNALAEYALAAAFMLGAVGFVLTQGDWGGKLAALQQDLLASSGLSVTGRTLTVPPLGTVVRPNKLATLEKQKICFASGSCINLPVIAAGATVTDTAGSLGGDLTNEFASVLQQLADELAAKNADPIVVQLVTELANSGHNVGNSISDFNNVLLKYDCDLRACDSSMMDPSDSWYIAGGANHIKSVVFSSGMKPRYDLLMAYLDANPSALASFPEAQNIIALEYNQIKTIVEGQQFGCANSASTCDWSTTAPTTTPLTPVTTTYHDPNTGNLVTSTYHMAGGTHPVYWETTVNGVTKTYSFNGAGWEPYVGTIPATYTGTSLILDNGTFPLESTQNNAELVHQDSNVICGSGGDVNNCVVDPNL